MPAFSRKKGGTLTDEQVKAIAGGIKSRWKAGPPGGPDARLSRRGRRRRGRRGAGAGVFDGPAPRCHGDGRAGGKDKVGPINDPAFLALISDQALRRFIITGRPDLGMPDYAGKAGRPPDFRPLTPAEIADLVALVSGWRRPDRPMSHHAHDFEGTRSMESDPDPTASPPGHPLAAARRSSAG